MKAWVLILYITGFGDAAATAIPVPGFFESREQCELAGNAAVMKKGTGGKVSWDPYITRSHQQAICVPSGHGETGGKVR